MIVFPENLDQLSDISKNLPAPTYTDEQTEQTGNFTQKWNAFDFLSTRIWTDNEDCPKIEQWIIFGVWRNSPKCLTLAYTS